MYIIYKHTCLVNQKSYIGLTKHSVEKRFKEHLYEALTNNQNKFYKALRKYSKENFVSEILEEDISNLKLANEREIYWIDYYDSYNNGYNNTRGGDTLHEQTKGKTYREIYGSEELAAEQIEKRKQKQIGKIVSEETKQKMSLNHWAKKGIEPWNKGKKITFSEVARNNISKAAREKVFTDEERQKMAERNKGEKNPNFGNKLSEAQKQKIRDKQNIKLICPYCEKEGGWSAMKRWHFDNCKMKDNI